MIIFHMFFMFHKDSHHISGSKYQFTLFLILCFVSLHPSQDLSREPITSRVQATILTFITYIGCGISAVFLSVTLLTYLAFGWVITRHATCRPYDNGPGPFDFAKMSNIHKTWQRIILLCPSGWCLLLKELTQYWLVTVHMFCVA